MQTRLPAKILCYFTVLLAVAGAASLPYLFESPSLFYKFGADKLMLRWGKITGLVAGVLIVFQAVSAARFAFLDRIFGLDRLWGFHRINGLVILALAVCHPVLILGADGFGFFPFTRRYWPEFLGIGVFLLLGGLVLAAWFHHRLIRDWQVWFAMHRFTALLVFILIFVHVWFVSKPFESGIPFWLLTGAFLTSFLVLGIKWAGVSGLFIRKYRVTAVDALAADAWQVVACPESGDGFDYLPGQFAFVRPRGKDLPKESHPFTISSSPHTKDRIEFIIRSCGDFTRTVRRLKSGDTLCIDGPYGRFSHRLLTRKRPVVMIAGGIGITPMMSMLRFMAATGFDQPVYLVWSNKTAGHLMFKAELDDMASHLTGLTIEHILTREPVHQTRFKRINRESLSDVLKPVSRDAAVFICGPPPLVLSVRPVLRELEFDPRRVYTESFLL